MVDLKAKQSQSVTASGDAPSKKAISKQDNVRKDKPKIEPEEIVKTPSVILKEEAECRAKRRKQKFKSRWPEVTKVHVPTKKWTPPPPPRRPAKIKVEIPTLPTRKWVPPYMRQKRKRPKLPRIPPEEITQPLYECKKLNKIWHQFQQVDKCKMMLQGNVGCNSKRYSHTHCGSQTACIAVVGHALLDEKKEHEFTKRDIDEVIEAGDVYYHQSMLANKCYKGKPQLELHQLNPSFFFRDTKYTIKLGEGEGGLLAKPPDNTSDAVDLAQAMEKLSGQEFNKILSVGDRHFLVWSHPPDPESGSPIKSIVYFLDPHMMNEIGQPAKIFFPYCCGAPTGGGGVLRYAGVNAFVMDFLANHGTSLLQDGKKKKEPPMFKLTDIEIAQKEPLLREPQFELDIKALKVHCQDEWENMNKNFLIERKLKHGEYPLASLSAVSLATARSRNRKKINEFYQKTSEKEPALEPPVPPEKPPEALTLEQVMEMQGEDFFLYCPKLDAHTFGRDDNVPLAKSETVLHSLVEIADHNFHSQFKQLDVEKWILRGTRHMASMRYSTFKTYTAIPCVLAALGMLRRYRARAWNEDMIDDTLDVGYNLFRESMVERGGPRRKLVLGELKDNFKIRDQEYTHKAKPIAVWGRILSSDSKVFDLCRGIEAFFKESDSGLLQIPGEYEMGIWNEGGKYYLYHPWPADEAGNRVGLQDGGKACVLAFPRPGRLCEHILENTKDLRRKPFSISDVGVIERPPMPEPVNNMKAVAPDRWVIRGKFHEGDERFPETHRNKQGTPASIAAIAMAHLVDSTEWSPSEVDESLVRGDILYQNTMDHLSRLGISLDTPKPTAEEEGDAEVEGLELETGEVSSQATGNLAAADVLNRFQMNEYDCIESEVLDSAYNGELDPPSNRGEGIQSLKACLKEMFNDHEHAVFTSRGKSLAVWKHKDSFYVFDPQGCDENGYPSDDLTAAAALIRVTGGHSSLADVLMGNLPPGADDSFNLSPVAITATKLNTLINAPETNLESKDMKWINKGTAAIMLGPRGENTAIGKAATKAGIGEEDQAGRALALPAAAAFCAAAGAVPPPHMHYDHMFSLLDAGADYYKAFVKKTGKKELEPDDLTEKFELGANTFSIELGEYMRLPLRLPDEPVGEDAGDDYGEGEQEPEVDTIKQIKEALMKKWMDTTFPSTLHLLVGDYHQLGVWMAPGGKVVVFDPAPTLVKGLLTPQRIRKGDELRIQRLKDEMEGEGGFDDELGEGEEQPVMESMPVPPDSGPALMVFASPGEFIDKLVIQGGLNKVQFIAPYKLYPVTVTNELTSLLKEKKTGEKKEKEKADGEEGDEESPEEEHLVDELADAAIGKYYERLGRTKASVRGKIAQGENYFMEELNRDLQDAANSVMGIVVDHIEPHIHWKPALIDAILKYGDRLHTMSLPFAKKPPRIKPKELQRKFKASGFYVKIKVDKDVITGDTRAGDKDGVLSLKKGIAKFFEDGFKHGVLCSKDYCVGIWRTTDGAGYALWDPHFVGPTGRTSPVGAATCVLFTNIDELAETFKENVEGLNRPGANNFSICAVNVDWQLATPGGWENKPAAVPDEGYEHRVLTAYVETAKGRTILRAPRPVDMARSAREALIQSASTAIVAACMSHIRKAALWSSRTLRDIQKAGAELTNRSLNALGYELRIPDEVLLPLQVLQRFILGTNYVRYDLSEVYSGKLEQKSAEAITLKAAIERFFETYTHGILWIAPYAVAVWKAPGIPPFYMYEVAPCSNLGVRVQGMEDGTACVQTFTSAKLMAFSFLQNFPAVDRLKTDFILYAMRTFVTPIKRRRTDPPLINAPPGSKLVPATSKVNFDGSKRRPFEGERRHPPRDPSCKDLQRVLEVRNMEDTALKGQRNASGWLVLADGSQYLSAQHSMQCRKFSAASRGNQGLSNAVMAVAVAKIEDVCRWNSSTLDHILESGDQLYQDSYLQYKPKTKILKMNQVLRKFYAPGNCVCRVVVFEPRQGGLVETDLAQQLSEFFREERCGVLVAGKGDFAVALFRTPKGYCMFDPDDRDRYGRAVPPPCRGRARACFSQYPTVQLLAEKLCPNVPPVLRYEGDEEEEEEDEEPPEDIEVVSTPSNASDTSEVRSAKKTAKEAAKAIKAAEKAAKKAAKAAAKAAKNAEKAAKKEAKRAAKAAKRGGDVSISSSVSTISTPAEKLEPEKERIYYTEAPTFKIYGMSVSSLRRLNQREN